MVVLALFGLVLWGGPVTSLWARTFAQPCPAAHNASDCLLTASGRVDSRFNDYAEGDVQLSLTIPTAPAGIPTDRGEIHAVFTPEASDRMGVYWDSHDVPVTVTLFNNEVAAITGPTGVTEESKVGVAEAFVMLLVMSAAAVLVVAGTGLLWRRIRGGEPGWIRRAAVCATVGTLVGAATGRAFGTLGVTWIMPATFATMALVSLAAAFVRLPRAWTRPADDTMSSPEHEPNLA
jgi:hypothetical protein